MSWFYCIQVAHNFLDPIVTLKVGLQVTNKGHYEVAVANGKRLPCFEQCLGIELWLQGTGITAYFYLLELGGCGCDIVFGAYWL